MLEIWRAGGSNTTATAEEAQATEAEGWDGQMFMDSQSLSADPYAQMGGWAMVTSKLKLSTGVTNPLTRHPAVTAAGAATIHSMTNGRAVLGIGRGDSALAYLGRAPVSPAGFERVLQDIQVLLSGGEIDFSAVDQSEEALSLDSMSLGDRPERARLHWLRKDLPKVEMDVAATGPKVIEMSARVAERVTFSVGSIPERMDWAIGLATEARKGAGLAAEGCSYGAQIILVCNPDMEAAMHLAMGFATPLVRFQVIQGNAAGPQTDADRENYAAVRKGYNMNKHSHTEPGTEKLVGTSLTPEFVQRFCIVGSPDHCTERMLELMKCGIERFVVCGPGFYPESWGEARHLFVREVMPVLRKEAAGVRERPKVLA